MNICLPENITPSVETIHFQINSQLGQDLELVFEEIIAKAKEYTSTYDDDRNTQKYLDSKFKYLTSFVKNVSTSKFKIAIEKNTNLILEGIILDSFASWWTVGKAKTYEDFNDIIDASAGIDISDVTSALTYDEMIKIGKDYDIATSKLLKNHNLNFNIQMVLGISVSFIGMYADIVGPDNDDVTAKELTAVVLHEIGHILATCERFADFGALTERQTAATTYFNKNANVKQKLDFLSASIDHPVIKNTVPVAALKTIKKSINDTKDNPLIVEEGDKNYNGGDPLLEITGTTPIGKFLVLVGLIGFKLASLIADFMYINMLYLFMFPIALIVKVCTKESDVKTSDVKNFNKLNTYAEKYADEFTTRHGYGRHLILVLKKLTYIHEHHSLSTMGSFRVIVWSKAANVARSCMYMLKFYNFLNMLISDPYYEVEHENDINRSMRVAKSLIPVFKKTDSIPKQLVDDYIKEYEALDKIITDIKQNTKSYRHYLFKAYTFIGNLPFLLSGFSGSVTSRHYDKMLDDVDELIRNKFFFLSAKLDQIKRNRK